ncbi:hypothetical protein MLD38_011365 [Melastoma candidum]|uniref:Uncharacterized protein n=1 Tax=Melastoma candidum TaxID=119954 RepID=A0ACB9R2X0_9MYRT|nr:hypothetical protein MLD38_011365 [Melastoma candidum]
MEHHQQQQLGQRSGGAATPSRAFQFHPARPAITELFNLYLGLRSSRSRPDDPVREPPNKTLKRVVALNRDLPPQNEQFILDFQQLQAQFPDQDQLRVVSESILISLVVVCCNHAPRADFLLFALQSLSNIGYINWDTFLPSLLSSISSAEMSVCQVGSSGPTVPSLSMPQSERMPSSSALPNSNFQPSNPASNLSSIQGIASPTQSSMELSSGMAVSPMKSPDISSTMMQASMRGSPLMRDSTLSSLRQLSCKIIVMGLAFNLKPVTHADILSHMLNWLVNWDQRQYDESDAIKLWRPGKARIEWLRNCLDVIWMLVEEDKCRVPFYELLRSGLQFIENIPDDEALFTLILEIHRRRDMMAMHMQMLDQHLHCPAFGTQRMLTQTTPNVSGEAVGNLRYSPITYPSVLGEPLHGEDLASLIERGSLDWERALRCIRHAIRATPSPDWWKRVLLVAPCYRNATQAPTPGAVFTSEMICEATIDRIVELLKWSNSEANCWQEWLIFSDIFFFLMKSGCIDFVDFVDKLVLRLTEGDHLILRTNHVTWLLAEVIRVEPVMEALLKDPRRVETTRKILCFHREDKSADTITPQSILLDFISSCQNLKIWSLSIATREYLNNEQLQKGKQIEEWWKQVGKGDRMIDYLNMDYQSMGMFWVVSYTMAQPVCDAVISWLSSAGGTELMHGANMPSNDMVIPSIAMVETYARLLLTAPHSLFRPHISHLAQRHPALLSKPGVTLLLFEILNYRLLPLYRYQGKTKALMYDVTKIIAALKGKRGEHRVFRLAENLCMNVILSLRDFFSVKREGKGPTEFTETLNRITVTTLAILIKTRGVADADHLLYVQTLLEQILATSQHTWSQKTLRYFPSVLRDALAGRMDKRALVLQAWKQAEATVINQCKQLLSASGDPSYVTTYTRSSFPEHRQHLCAGAWILMQGHPENVNSQNLVRVLREFSPEEVTANIYTMVDVLLHQIQIELQLGHSLQDILIKTCANLTFLVWTHELLPLDILLLALIDRDDDPHALRIVINLLDRQDIQQRVKLYCMNRGAPDHWNFAGPFKRVELQKALGSHLSWKDRYPPFFDDIVARLLPVIPLIVYRLIENDAMDPADVVLAMYSQFLAYHPFRFTFVRDILAYFYGHLPGKLIVRILKVLDLNKIPFSESFPQHISSPNPVMCPPLDYFATLLLGLVNNVIPLLGSSAKSSSGGDTLNGSSRAPPNKAPPTTQAGQGNSADAQKSFYQIQDPGTYTQLMLETAVIELLSLPVPASQIVSSLVQIVVNIQPTLIQSSNSIHGAPNSMGQALPTSPSGGSTDSLGTSRSSPSVSGLSTSNFVWKSGYSCQQLSCLLIQACGLLLAQLPTEFHAQLYVEASRVVKESWWLTDGKRSLGQLDSAVGYALLDPTWAAQDNTSTAIGNIVALLHSFFSNLPQEWLEGAHAIIKHLRPITSVAMLRIAFRIMGPLLPRLANAHSLFNKTLSLLLGVMVDVFGRNAQSSAPAEASEIVDLVDFLHHVVHYEGQGGPVQANSKPRPEILALISRACESLRPDLQHLLSHLKTDVNSSVYAATHPKIVQNPPAP